MAERAGHGYQGMSPEIGLKVSPAGESGLYLYQQFSFRRLRDGNLLNFDRPRTFEDGGKHVSDFHSCAEDLAQDSHNKENRYVAPIQMRKYPGEGNKRDRQMDIEEPLKGEFFLFAPEITEKHVQPKGKNAYQ